jgi:D-psicose/D-tagatose/L-ribulose 3-epimerase
MLFGANTFIWASPFSTRDLSLVEKVRALGFDSFEVAVEDPALIDVAALKQALAENGLQGIICGAFGPDRDLSSANPTIRQNSADYIRWLIDAAAAIQSPIVAGPMYASVGKAHPDTDAEIQAEYARSVAEIQVLAAYAADRHIKLALEMLNRFETDMLNTAAQGLAFCRAVGAANVGLHLDTFHMHLEEKDSAAAIRAAGEQLFHFHACENDRGIPGTGQVHWSAVLAALTDIHYRGAVVIESFTPQVKTIARAVAIWRQIAPDQDSIARDGLAFLKRSLQGKG